MGGRGRGRERGKGEGERETDMLAAFQAFVPMPSFVVTPFNLVQVPTLDSAARDND